MQAGIFVETEIWLGFLAQSRAGSVFRSRFQEDLRLTLEKTATKERVARLLEIECKPDEELSKVMTADFE